MENKEFVQYIYSRCDETLIQDATYMDMQSKYVDAVKEKNNKSAEELTELMEIRATELCYMQGFRDAISLLMNK